MNPHTLSPVDPDTWQKTINQLVAVRQQLDELTRVLHSLNPRLCDVFPSEAERAERIQAFICARYNVTRTQLTGPNRQVAYVLPRHRAMFLIRRYCPSITLAAIGSLFGGRDHGSVIHAINTTQGYADVNASDHTALQALCTACEKYLGPENLPATDQQRSAA